MRTANATATLPLVLYVEDSVDNWEVTRLHLSRRFGLLRARSDLEACEIIRQRHDELAAILMDIELQGSVLDGIQLTRLLRGVQSGIEPPEYARSLPSVSVPIFFITVYSARYSPNDLVAAGADRVLTKPVDFPELSLALAQIQVTQQEGPTHLLLKTSDPRASAAKTLGLLQEDPIIAARVEALLGNTMLRLPSRLDQLAIPTLRDLLVCLAILLEYFWRCGAQQGQEGPRRPM